MDNTCRDNKNKYMLVYSALLVEIGLFVKVSFNGNLRVHAAYDLQCIHTYTQVKISFLPVGHTHEDIDQLFSCISRCLKHTNIITLPGKNHTHA